MIENKLKLLSLIVIVIILALAVTQTGITSADSGAGALHNRDIKFDGYCDGAHLSVNTGTGLVGGYQLGCVSGNMLGTFGNITNHGTAVAMSYATDSPYLGLHMVVVANPRFWYLYQSNGNGGIVLLNSGTWSYGAPSNASDDPPSSR